MNITVTAFTETKKFYHTYFGMLYYAAHNNVAYLASRQMHNFRVSSESYDLFPFQSQFISELDRL